MVLLLYGGSLYAQEATVTSGADATGTGGTVSYSIGQVAYVTDTSSEGTVTQGVQQPYEIYAITGIENEKISLDFSVYPNPTTDILYLKVEDNEDVFYQLFDLKGRMVDSEKALMKDTRISMKEFEASTYFLKVMKGEQLVKTFKIIKN